MAFESIVGHQKPITLLRSMLKSSLIPHAFLFSGNEGIGKRMVALSFVKSLNCRDEGDDCCDVCRSCSKIDGMIHPDVVLVEPEKNVIKIDQIRTIQQDIAFQPLEGRKKAVLIDQAERMNASAANCLLKTLEEPPEDTVLILIAGGSADMLPTILSRCQRLPFSPLGRKDLVEVLCSLGSDTAEAEQVAPYADGSVGKAGLLLESGFLQRRADIAGVFQSTDAATVDSLLGLAQQMSADAASIDLMLEFLLAWYRDVLLAREGLPESLLHNSDLIDDIYNAAALETRDSLVAKIKKIQWIQNSAALNPDMQLGLESVFLQ